MASPGEIETMDIETMDIDTLKLNFSALMNAVVTTYGDDQEGTSEQEEQTNATN